MGITKIQIIGVIITIILILITSLVEELTTITKIYIIVILAIVIIIIFIFAPIKNTIKTKIREFRKIRRLKIIVTEEIKAIKRGREPTIALNDLNYIHKHRDKFKKIEGLNDVFFKYFIDKQVLFAKKIIKNNENSKKREAELYKKLFKK